METIKKLQEGDSNTQVRVFLELFITSIILLAVAHFCFGVPINLK